MKRNVKTWVTHGETENLEDREEGAVRRGMPAAIAPCSLDDILLSLSCLSFIRRGVKSSFFFDVLFLFLASSSSLKLFVFHILES